MLDYFYHSHIKTICYNENGDNMKKKLPIILLILLLIIIVLFVSQILKKEYVIDYNKNYIQNYITENYQDYKLVSVKYEYLDTFWSSYYDIEEDDVNKEIICNATLQNMQTGMHITIPFHHDKNSVFTDTQYGRKNIKNIVKEYEKYWESIDKIKSNYNTEIKVSNAQIEETDGSDIYELSIYIIDNVNAKDIITKINDLKTPVGIRNVNYVVTNELIYEKLDPWLEPNKYLLVPDNMKSVDKDSNFTLYIDNYENGKYRFTNYYA